MLVFSNCCCVTSKFITNYLILCCNFTLFFCDVCIIQKPCIKGIFMEALLFAANYCKIERNVDSKYWKECDAASNDILGSNNLILWSMQNSRECIITTNLNLVKLNQIILGLYECCLGRNQAFYIIFAKIYELFFNINLTLKHDCLGLFHQNGVKLTQNNYVMLDTSNDKNHIAFGETFFDIVRQCEFKHSNILNNNGSSIFGLFRSYGGYNGITLTKLLDNMSEKHNANLKLCNILCLGAVSRDHFVLPLINKYSGEIHLFETGPNCRAKTLDKLLTDIKQDFQINTLAIRECSRTICHYYCDWFGMNLETDYDFYASLLFFKRFLFNDTAQMLHAQSQALNSKSETNKVLNNTNNGLDGVKSIEEGKSEANEMNIDYRRGIQLYFECNEISKVRQFNLWLDWLHQNEVITPILIFVANSSVMDIYQNNFYKVLKKYVNDIYFAFHGIEEAELKKQLRLFGSNGKSALIISFKLIEEYNKYLSETASINNNDNNNSNSNNNDIITENVPDFGLLVQSSFSNVHNIFYCDIPKNNEMIDYCNRRIHIFQRNSNNLNRFYLMDKYDSIESLNYLEKSQNLSLDNKFAIYSAIHAIEKLQRNSTDSKQNNNTERSNEETSVTAQMMNSALKLAKNNEFTAAIAIMNTLLTNNLSFNNEEKIAIVKKLNDIKEAKRSFENCGMQDNYIANKVSNKMGDDKDIEMNTSQNTGNYNNEDNQQFLRHRVRGLDTKKWDTANGGKIKQFAPY